MIQAQQHGTFSIKKSPSEQRGDSPLKNTGSSDGISGASIKDYYPDSLRIANLEILGFSIERKKISSPRRE